MAWEKRGNKKYYYRKQRVGKKVISEYIGAGPNAEKIAREDELQRRIGRKLRIQASIRRIAEAVKLKLMDAIGGISTGLDKLSRTFTYMPILLLAGYHTHKGASGGEKEDDRQRMTIRLSERWDRDLLWELNELMLARDRS